MNQHPFRDELSYYAAHAPDVPVWFVRNTWNEEREVPAPELGDGRVRLGSFYCEEPEMDRLTRWRFEYARAMIVARKARA